MLPGEIPPGKQVHHQHGHNGGHDHNGDYDKYRLKFGYSQIVGQFHVTLAQNMESIGFWVRIPNELDTKTKTRKRGTMRSGQFCQLSIGSFVHNLYNMSIP